MKKHPRVFTILIMIILSLAAIPFVEGVDLVLVCHRGADKLVALLKVQDHLDHGDTLGSCFTLPPSSVETVKKRSSNCSDCTPPKFIDFQINNMTFTDLSFQQETDPLMIAVNQSISLNMTVYESRINHIDVIQFSLVPQVRDSGNDGEGLIEFHFGWDNEIDKIVVTDMVNVISFDNKLVSCNYTECMQLTVEYFYNTRPENSVFNLNTFDVSHNPSNVYFNDFFEFQKEVIILDKKSFIKTENKIKFNELYIQEQIAINFMKSYYRDYPF